MSQINIKQRVAKILKIVVIYFGVYAISTVFFVILFHTPLLKNMEVLMYRGIAFILGTGGLSVVLMLVAKRVWKDLLDCKDVFLMFCMYCSVNMVLFTLIPVTVERSVSVFTLSYMMENPKAYTIDEMEEVFYDKYVQEFDAFDKRFAEQIVSGNVEATEEGYVINERGVFTVKFFRVVSKLFHTDQRLIYPNECAECDKEEQQKEAFEENEFTEK